jgi:hypothetical protein
MAAAGGGWLRLLPRGRLKCCWLAAAGPGEARSATMAAAGTTTQLLAILGLVLSPLITLGASDWSCADAQRKWERSKDHPSDRAELFSFAKATAVQNWTDGSRAWLNESSSVCEWEGVCCVPFAGLSRVTELHVERNGLTGAFPPTFTKMSKLRVLDVHLNNMTNFPPGIEKLNELQQAKFGRNPICGTAKEVLSGFAVLTNLTHFNCNFCCASSRRRAPCLAARPPQPAARRTPLRYCCCGLTGRTACDWLAAPSYRACGRPQRRVSRHTCEQATARGDVLGRQQFHRQDPALRRQTQGFDQDQLQFEQHVWAVS